MTGRVGCVLAFSVPPLASRAAPFLTPFRFNFFLDDFMEFWMRLPYPRGDSRPLRALRALWRLWRPFAPSEGASRPLEALCASKSSFSLFFSILMLYDIGGALQASEMLL